MGEETNTPAGAGVDAVTGLLANWKVLGLLLLLSGGAGTAGKLLPIGESAVPRADFEPRVIVLESQLSAIHLEIEHERELREIGVNGNTLQINDLRNRVGALENRVASFR